MNARELRREAMRIGGEKVHRDRVIEVFNPYTEQLIGTVPKATLEDVRRAFAIAKAYKPKLTRFERAAILTRRPRSSAAALDEISDLITAECGLCKKDSLYEIGRVSDVLLFGANEALKDDGQIFSCDLTPHGKKRRVYTQREPLLGVITAITPFNHPMNQVAHKVVPAIVTNNRMVLKPSEKVPFSAIAARRHAVRSGPAAEMYQVVTGDPSEIADELLTNRRVDLITFTGGVAIGKYIASKAGYRRHGARARRQRPDHRHGGRRPRGGRDLGRRRLVQEFGPALHRDQADAGARIGRRPLRRAAGRQDEGLDATATRWTRSSRWAPSIDEAAAR